MAEISLVTREETLVKPTWLSQVLQVPLEKDEVVIPERIFVECLGSLCDDLAVNLKPITNCREVADDLFSEYPVVIL